MCTPRIRSVLLAAPVFSGMLALSACADSAAPTAVLEPGSAAASRAGASAPAELATVTFADLQLELWPFTGNDFRGTRESASDPINLIFVGESDPRNIREALMSLDGNRTAFGFPPVFPFNCIWSDAMGANQTAYADHHGWSGSAIQLECGEYDGLRFHIRLFRTGDVTLANAHFETVIPGTTNHEVLSWQLAEQFVTVDMVRSGLLHPTLPLGESGAIHPVGWFRTINPLIYHHPALQPLHPLLEAVIDEVSGEIGIRTDGTATILNVARAAERRPGRFTDEQEISFGQIIPKPFCNAGHEFVLVVGPVRLRQQVVVTPSGKYSNEFHADGELSVTPVNPFTREAIGPTARARVGNLYKGQVTDHVHSASGSARQMLMREGMPNQHLKVDLQVGPHGLTRFSLDEHCGAQGPKM
jgi:hypothetical protein